MLDVSPSAIIFLALLISQIFLLTFIRAVEGSSEIKEDHVLSRLIRLEEKDREQEGRFNAMESKIKQQETRISQLESNRFDNHDELIYDNEKIKSSPTKSDSKKDIKKEGRRGKRPERLLPSTSLLINGGLKNNTGNEAIKNKIPSSCQDLNLLGHTLSNFYLVQGNKPTTTKLQTIYCNFQPSTNKTGQLIKETKIGFVDIKTMESGVHFYAHQSSKAPNRNGIMLFDVVRLNLGGALNAKTGIFTAPRPGVYQFAFKGMKSTLFIDSVVIHLRVNNVKSSTAFCNAGLGTSIPVSFHFILKLAKGDRVDLYKTSGQLDHNDKEPRIHYTGTLLEEDLNQI